MIERKEREKEVINSGSKRKVSEGELFHRAGHLIKRVK